MALVLDAWRFSSQAAACKKNSSIRDEEQKALDEPCQPETVIGSGQINIPSRSYKPRILESIAGAQRIGGLAETRPHCAVDPPEQDLCTR